MTPERRRRIEQIYNAVLEQKVEGRSAFLAEACYGDEELRRQVESLLAGDRTSVPATTIIALGFQLGVYRLEAKLGEGGMGVVFRALDAKLNRPVAVKFLSDHLADATARRRFQREAQMASSLNHPHILTVHDAGEFQGRQYLVTEFVDGGTLKDWAHAEKRTWRQILDLLAGVADGLAAAHAAGILHRDIKPANILVAKNGYAKLADFGLAKLEDTPAPVDASGTLVEGRTHPGLIVGTVAYMSPEQASGLTIDARSDIFSFGVLLYELLTSRRAFSGATDLEVLQTIIHGTPEPLPPDLPAGLRIAVEKALEKDPAERYQSMREFVVDLRRLARKSLPDVTASRAPVHKLQPRLMRWMAVMLVAVGAGLAGWFLQTRFAKRPPPQTVVVQRLTDAVGLEETPAISPDGKTVAFGADTGGQRQIWVRLLGGGAPLAITKDTAEHYAPRWSPDSASLIYYTAGAQPGEPGTIWEIPALGGSARRLVPALGPGDLSHDGRNLASFRIKDGATELAIAARDLSSIGTVARLPVGAGYSNLRWSPDDRRIALQQDAGGSFFLPI